MALLVQQSSTSGSVVRGLSSCWKRICPGPPCGGSGCQMSGTLRSQETAKELVLDPVARLKMLGEQGSSVAIDESIPVKIYLTSGSEMERQVMACYSEGQWDRAFMLYSKFATLFIEKLPKHPEYSKGNPADKAHIRKLLKESLPSAMDLKES